MKKIFTGLCLFCVMLLPFGLTACGRDFAKIIGIRAGMVEVKDPVYSFEYGNPLSDNETIAENDYILRVGQNYFLGVTYSQTGGSRVASIATHVITLKYDTEILEITQPEEKEGMTVYYKLICKKAVVNTSVTIEVSGEYTCTVIISAE